MNDGPPTQTRVTVTDVDMPFGSMVVFMVKWALATIPAFLILALLGVVVYLLVGMASIGFTQAP